MRTLEQVRFYKVEPYNRDEDIVYCIDLAEAQTELMMHKGNVKIGNDIYIKVTDAVDTLRNLRQYSPKGKWIGDGEHGQKRI